MKKKTTTRESKKKRKKKKGKKEREVFAFFVEGAKLLQQNSREEIHIYGQKLSK